MKSFGQGVLVFSLFTSLLTITACGNSSNNSNDPKAPFDNQTVPKETKTSEVTFTWTGESKPARVVYNSNDTAQVFAGRIADGKVLKSKIKCAVDAVEDTTVLTISVDSVENEQTPYEGYDLLMAVDSKTLEKKEYKSNDFGYPRMAIRGCVSTSAGKSCRGDRETLKNESILGATYTVKSLDPLVINGTGQLNGANLSVSFSVSCGKLESKNKAAPESTPTPAPTSTPAPSETVPAKADKTTKPVKKKPIPKTVICDAVENTDNASEPRGRVTVTIRTTPKTDITLNETKTNRKTRFGEVAFENYKFTQSNSICQKTADQTENEIKISSYCDYLVNGGQTVSSTFGGTLELDNDGTGSFTTYGRPANFDSKILKSYALSKCK